MQTASPQPIAAIERLRRAVNAHDIDAVVACFTDDYRNETPAHPGRGFTGTTQVRTNWSRIFAGIPEIEADVVRTSTDGNTIWTEWDMHGTRPDGLPEAMRGVIIFEVDGDRLSSSRFYVERVDSGDDGHDGAVGRVIGDSSAANPRVAS
jgi:limonene-1,2-epoxide hydrolase